MAPPLEFVLLSDRSDLLRKIAEWNQTQWGYLRPGSTTQFFIEQFKQRLNRDCLPLTYIAFIKGNPVPVGTFSLIGDIYTMGYPDTPMLNNVIVVEEYRRQGIGKAMVAKAEEVAGELGYDRIFLFTSDKKLNQFYNSIAWEETRTGKFLDNCDIWFFEKETPLVLKTRCKR